MTNENTVASRNFRVSKQSFSKEEIHTKVNGTLVELGFESNYNNINSDWHVYKTYNSNIFVVGENIIEFSDFIEADINIYDKDAFYEIEINKYDGNISDVELFHVLHTSFSEVNHKESSSSSSSLVSWSFIVRMILSVLSFLGCFIR
jgi:hypothetical protein